MFRMKSLVLSVLLAGLGGCAGMNKAAVVPATAKIDKVAVVSVVGPVFARAYTGFTVFNNEYETMDIGAWQLDRDLSVLARSSLAKLNFATVDVGDAPPDFSFLNGDANSWGGAWEKIQGPTLALCAKHGLDAVVVIGRSKTEDFLTGSNQSFAGAGVYGRGGLAVAAKLHLVANMGVMNCQTGQPWATSLVTREPDQSYSSRRNGMPMEQLELAEIKMPISSWTAEQKENYRKTLLAQSAGPIDATVRFLFGKP